MMVSAEFIDSDLEDWKHKESMLLGHKGGLAAPKAYVGVSLDGIRFRLINLYAHDEYMCFKSLKVSGYDLVIGFGESVHFINVKTGFSKSVKLDGYFGELYTPEEFDLDDSEFDVLIASCDYLHHFDFSGAELWKSGQLGIDGVIVQDVKPPLIRVVGEWDPPGGWQETMLNLSDGKNAI